MANGRFISYLRVSTQKQGQSGLGEEAQRAAVAAYLNGGEWTLLREFVEIESGKKNDRPQLAEALALCRRTGAVLVVAKLDRLARDTLFLLTVQRDSGDAGVVFCDLPTVPPGPMGKFFITQMAAVAELEAGLISQRTKAALAEAKKGGTKLGGYRGGPVVNHVAGTAAIRAKADAAAAEAGPVARALRDSGMSLAAVAAALTQQLYRTPRNSAWTPAAVSNLLARHAALGVAA